MIELSLMFVLVLVWINSRLWQNHLENVQNNNKS
jgi:hypothetical protein